MFLIRKAMEYAKAQDARNHIRAQVYRWWAGARSGRRLTPHAQCFLQERKLRTYQKKKELQNMAHIRSVSIMLSTVRSPESNTFDSPSPVALKASFSSPAS